MKEMEDLTKKHTFTVDFLLDTTETGILDSTMTTINYIHKLATLRTTQKTLFIESQKSTRKNIHQPLKMALLKRTQAPPNKTNPPIPPRAPFGALPPLKPPPGKPPPPPDFCFMTCWRRAQASLVLFGSIVVFCVCCCPGSKKLEVRKGGCFGVELRKKVESKVGWRPGRRRR